MIRRHSMFFRLGLMAADAVLALGVVVIAAQLRFGRTDWARNLGQALPDPYLAVAAFIVAWIALLWARGLYRGRTRWTVAGDAVEILKAAITLVAITLSALFLFKLPDVSRLVLLFVFPAMAAAALAVRVAARFSFIFLREHGRNVRYMLVLGANARAKAFADLVECHTELGLVVIGHLKADATDNGVDLGRPLLGSIDALEDVLHSRIVDEVAICLPFSMEDLVEQTARLCGQEGKAVRIPIAPIERVLTMGRLEAIDGLGVYSLVSGPDRLLSLMVKRALDLAVATVLLVVLSPVLAVLGLVVKFDSPGPVFFRQERVGLNGRLFRVIKFRTMCDHAEDQRDDLIARNEIHGSAFKIQDDPRITRTGKWLRRTSLDELPQLANVLRGQMSLVGPRPPLPGEVADYDIWHRRRLSMKPGMTGLWQVGNRQDHEFDHWVEKDLEYIDTWSLWLDFKIMARTVPAVLSGTGR
jgi:exopolysaccharide biosynthesis polyprenyl glycosylphosphotransferase